MALRCLTYWSQLLEPIDHLIQGVPASSNITKKLQIRNLDGLPFLILEPFLVVAVAYDLTKVVMLFTRGPNGTDTEQWDHKQQPP